MCALGNFREKSVKSMRLLHGVRAHNDKIWSVSSHQKLPLLATGSSDKTSAIFRLSEKEKFPKITTLDDTHTRSIRSVMFKPPIDDTVVEENELLDPPTLAMGSFDAKLSVWQAELPQDNDEDMDQEPREIWEKERKMVERAAQWELMAVIEGHEHEVKAVAWNCHGSLVASCSRDKTIWIWETDPDTLEEFECISVLTEHQQDVKHVIWHPTQNLLASSSYDDTICIYRQEYDDDDWGCAAVLNGHQGTVWCSAFEHPQSPSASETTVRLVSASDDLTVRIWSTSKEGSETKHDALPSSIKLSNDMHWEQECILPSVHTYPVYSVVWSSVSGRIASAGADGKIAVYTQKDGVWDIEGVTSAAHGVHEINALAWSKLDDNREVLVSGGDDGYVNVWE